MKTPADVIPVKYEGGPANGTAQSVHPGVHTVWYGPRGEEEKYVRTDRTDGKGRAIFAHRPRSPN